MNLFPPLDPQLKPCMDELLKTIEKTFPLPRRFRPGLPKDVAELSALFTSRRYERNLSYLGKPNNLSAYLRYFLPWNVYRLCRLLPSLKLELKTGDVILDLGSGPLSFVLALWFSSPELRELPLEFFCIDQTPSVLEAGRKIFNAITSPEGPTDNINEKTKWKIRTLRGELGRNGHILIDRKITRPEKICNGKATALVCAVNVYNEIYWELSPADKDGLRDLAEQNSRLLGSCGKNCSVLIVEPGIPRSGAFISSLRSSMIEQGFDIISPCSHNESCSFPGEGKGKPKWCHFSFDTDDAPTTLHKLSNAAGISKERAVMSFLFARNSSQIETQKKSRNSTEVRVISDMFPVGALYGRYACSALGPVLATGSKAKMETIDSGSLIMVNINGGRDQKSGALIGELI
jgi:ribosomal protein RSM22 (predicted rRNA methylase)